MLCGNQRTLEVLAVSSSPCQALVYYKPKRIAIRGGYWGCHRTIEVYNKTQEREIQIIDLDDDYKPGDLCWVETPVNPTGESR